jgi:hypothetical protein
VSGDYRHFGPDRRISAVAVRIGRGNGGFAAGFGDTILSLVASVQLTTNDMPRGAIDHHARERRRRCDHISLHGKSRILTATINVNSYQIGFANGCSRIGADSEAGLRIKRSIQLDQVNSIRFRMMTRLLIFKKFKMLKAILPSATKLLIGMR